MASLRKRGAHWYIRYRTPDGKSTEVKAGPDKGVAKAMARDLDAKLQRIKLGLLDPREVAAIEAEKSPVATHVNDYIAHLTAKGSAPEHVDGVRHRLVWFLDETKIVRLSQVRPSLAQAALKALRDAHKSDQTVAHYCNAWKAFTAWLKRDRRTQEDLLGDLERPAITETRERIDLPPELAARLIQATRNGPMRRGLDGETRSWLYVLAMTTGLRRSELQALTPAHFSLDRGIPTVSLPGTATKNGKTALQPIPAHLVPALRDWLSRRPPALPLFRGDRNSAALIRADLRAAQIPSDRYDFHSLRHTYITRISETGATVKDHMSLARHSDPDLTLNRYSHSNLESLASVVNKLPTLMVGICGQAIPYANLPTTCPQPQSQGDSSGHGKHSPEGTEGDHKRQGRERRGPDSKSHKSLPRNGEASHQNPVAHDLPTDLDLALVLEAWEQLPEEVKAAITRLALEARS